MLATVRSAGDDGGRISDELFEVRRTVDGRADLRNALSDPLAVTDDKRALLRRLLESKVQPATLLLVEQAVTGRHGTIDAGARGVPAHRGRGPGGEDRDRAHRP